MGPALNGTSGSNRAIWSSVVLRESSDQDGRPERATLLVFVSLRPWDIIRGHSYSRDDGSPAGLGKSWAGVAALWRQDLGSSLLVCRRHMKIAIVSCAMPSSCIHAGASA
jgi:hypothetical protein